MGDFPPPPESNRSHWERVWIDCAVKETGAGAGPENWKGRSRPENICTGSNLIQRLAKSSKEHPPLPQAWLRNPQLGGPQGLRARGDVEHQEISIPWRLQGIMLRAPGELGQGLV